MDIQAAENQNPQENENLVNQEEILPTDQVEKPEAPAAPDEIPAPPEAKPVTDRAAFNCAPCKGEGLIGNPAGIHKVCEACNGTGKV